MERISQEWLKIQDSYMTTNRIRREAFIWRLSLVEASIERFIELWEQRNKEVHGKLKHKNKIDD